MLGSYVATEEKEMEAWYLYGLAYIAATMVLEDNEGY